MADNKAVCGGKMAFFRTYQEIRDGFRVVEKELDKLPDAPKDPTRRGMEAAIVYIYDMIQKDPRSLLAQIDIRSRHSGDKQADSVRESLLEQYKEHLPIEMVERKRRKEDRG